MNRESKEFDNQDEMLWLNRVIIPVYVTKIDESCIYFELEGGGIISSYEIANLQFKPCIEQQIYLVTEEYKIVAVFTSDFIQRLRKSSI